MNRLEAPGVLGAVNAFAVTENGEYAYLFDPRVDATIRIDLQRNTTTVLKWYDRAFHHCRWLCYCLFCFERNNVTYLPVLFYNKKRKKFVLVTFKLDENRNVLQKYEERDMNSDSVRPERLAYVAHRSDLKIHIIFYERFQRSSTPTDEGISLPFVHNVYDSTTGSVKSKEGLLPPGQWELPFLAHQNLYFISMEDATTHKIAETSVLSDCSCSTWNTRRILSDNNDEIPPRKAAWCNAWRYDMAWYLICEKVVEDFDAKRVMTLWQLDVLDCRWRKLPLSIDAPLTASNFSLRIDFNNTAYLHCDWDRNASIYKFNLNQLMTERDDLPDVDGDDESNIDGRKFRKISQSGSDFDRVDLNNIEIICPVCLDTYDDPRFLPCGHSLCNGCIENMRLAAGGSAIRCFACRKAVTIPIQGFPINFGLRDAVATLTKVQQLSESTLRCSKCRAPCDQTEIWICVECNREAITSILIDDDISDIEETEKSTCLCASCSLRFHFKHELVEFSRLRQRRNKVFELRKQKMHDIDEMLDDLSRSFLKKLRPCLIKPLKDEFDAKLSDLSCSVDHSIEEIDQISTKLIEEFAERLRNIEQNIDVQFKMLMLPCGIRESRYERPTQL